MKRIKRLTQILLLLLCGVMMAQSNNSSQANLSAGGQIFLEHFSGKDFGVRLQTAIDALPATGGIINCRGVKGRQTMNKPVNINKPAIIYLGEMVLIMNNSGNENMFNIKSNSVSVIGLGRSANKRRKTAPTRLIMANSAGDVLHGYHFYNRGFSVVNLIGFDIEGLRTSLGCQYGSRSYPLNGVGGIYMEKPNPGTVSSGNAISQIVVEDVYIENTKAHAIYFDTPILSTIKNVRISGAGGHGIFVRGGTSLTLNSVYVSSANLAGVALFGLVYGTVINSVTEYCGIGWWLRSVHSVTLLSPGVEQTYNLGQSPWKRSQPETGQVGMNLHTTDASGRKVAISDVNKSFASDFRGHGYLITGGSSIFISSPYCVDPGHSKSYQMYSGNNATGQSSKTRFVKVVSTNDNSVIINPKTKVSSKYTKLNNSFDIEIAPEVKGMCLEWNPETGGTVKPKKDGVYISSSTKQSAPLFLGSSSTLVKSGNHVFSDMIFDSSPIKKHSTGIYNIGIEDNNKTVVFNTSNRVSVKLPALSKPVVVTLVSKQSSGALLRASSSVLLNGVSGGTYSVNKAYKTVKLVFSPEDKEWLVLE